MHLVENFAFMGPRDGGNAHPVPVRRPCRELCISLGASIFFQPCFTLPQAFDRILASLSPILMLNVQSKADRDGTSSVHCLALDPSASNPSHDLWISHTMFPDLTQVVPPTWDLPHSAPGPQVCPSVVMFNLKHHQVIAG